MVKISVIIPTLDEASRVGGAIASSWRANADEVIVVDGGSSDATVGLSQAAGAQVLLAKMPGRGGQLGLGGDTATGDWLVFLHADNQLPVSLRDQLAAADWPAWGGLHQRIDAPEWRFRWIERGNAARIRWRSCVFGDQAMFVRRDWYRKAGGFEPIPLMEDLRLSHALRRRASATLLPGPVLVDARRWRQHGVLRQTLRNWSLQWQHARGVDPESLSARYHRMP